MQVQGDARGAKTLTTTMSSVCCNAGLLAGGQAAVSLNSVSPSCRCVKPSLYKRFGGGTDCKRSIHRLSRDDVATLYELLLAVDPGL
jgi:hypothetical protein